MTGQNEKEVAIGSDVPQTDPSNDSFGYAPFAQHIADAFCKTPSPQGLVMAIHGSWGAGKTTLLNFVKYRLNQLPDNEKPIIIDFNPWWFTSREHLAAQFLSHFRSKLIHESKILRSIGDGIAEYANSIGTIIAGTYGIFWLDKVISFFLKLLKRRPKDVPALKAEISTALQEANQRFVFIIDDIDRLAPDEIRELFKVIKALADFPNVIYLLSFDRQAVSTALYKSLGIDGVAYLEKLIQVPFSLPAIDHMRLRQKLFLGLDKILKSFPPRGFDQTYWGNVYFDGLDPYLNKPRDIVRIVNVLNVTYPPIAGEVNPVDFFALEFLRVFEPEVYEIIRDNQDKFSGQFGRSDKLETDIARSFHDAWFEKIQSDHKSSVKALLLRLFPKVEAVWSNRTYSAEWIAGWRKELRVCSPELFEIYFQFGVSPQRVSHADLDGLLSIGTDPEKIIQVLKSASNVLRPDGTSKARDYLDRLHDLTDEITPEIATGFLTAIFKVGDTLLSPGDEQGGILSFPNRWRLQWTTSHLLNRIPVPERQTILEKLISQGEGLGHIVNILETIESLKSEGDESQDSPLAKFEEGTFNSLKEIVIDRLNNLSEQDLLKIPELGFVIHYWIKWAGQEDVISKIRPVFDSDKYLPEILEKYLLFGAAQGMGDRVGRRVPQLKIEEIKSITDISILRYRVEKMLLRTDLTSNQRTAGEQFFKSFKKQDEKEPI